jgi:hypothetical protein
MGRSNQGAFKGTNKMCQQCSKECKQFSNVTVIKCSFVSNQKTRHTLPLAENDTCRGENGIKQPNMASA